MKSTKNIKSISLLFVALSIIFLSACSSSPKNLTAIPSNTNLVAVIDAYSIAKKGKLDELKDLKIFKTFRKEVRSENRKIARLMDNMMEDPSISGINFKNDIFLYSINEAKDENFGCVAVELKSEGKFVEFIEDVLDKSEVEFDIEKEKTYSFILIESSAAIAWDNNKAVFIGPSNYRSRKNLDFAIESIFELNDKDQITSNDEFSSFYKKKKDLSVWLSTNYFEDFREFKMIEREAPYDLTDNFITSYLNFEDDKISMLTHISPNEEIKKMMEEDELMGDDFNSTLLNYFPKQNFITSSISLNPKAVYKLLSEEKGFEEVEKDFKIETGLDIEDIFESLEGNILYSLSDVKKTEYTYYGWGYGFDESEAKLLPMRYPISQAGYISTADKELLNEGKTIQSEAYNRRYCINIKNILANGGTVESALENDEKINWYEGGWTYGKNIKRTREDFLPTMGIAFDINNNEFIKDMLDKAPENSLTKTKGYYEFKFDNRYPAYLAFDKKVCLITNDKEAISDFSNGGYTKDNLSASEYKSEITNNPFYTHINLDYNSFPKNIKKQIKESQGSRDTKLIKAWKKMAKGIEIKQLDDNSVEIVFETQDNGENALSSIIQLIDDLN